MPAATSVAHRPRVVFFTPGHNEIGGVQRRSRLLADSFVARGWQVRVVARAGTLDRFCTTSQEHCVVVEVPGFNRPRLGAALYLAVAIPLGLVWGVRARALLAIQVSSPAIAASMCGLVLRRPLLILTSISGRVSEVGEVSASRIASLRKALLRRATYLVGQTRGAAAELSRLAPNTPIAVVPNPVVAVSPSPLSGRPAVIYTGRLGLHKNLETLLAAWSAIAGGDSAARLLLVGEGGQYDSVEDRLRAAVACDPFLRRSVTFTGWVPDVGPYIRDADVFVLPSLVEGMSNALLEACAYRRVVVASDIEQNRSVVGDEYPLLFPPSDTKALIAALRKALYDGEVRKDCLEEIGRRMHRFAPDTVVSQLEALLSRVPADSVGAG